MNCPNCGKGLGKPIDIDMNRVGWSCNDCLITVYQMKEKYEGVIL